MNSGLPRRCELPLSMGCRIQTTTQTSERGELSAPDHDRALLLTKNGLQSNDEHESRLPCNTRCEASWGALCCRSSPLRAMIIRLSAIARAYTVPRLRRLLLMEQQLDGCRGTRSSSEEVSMLATELDSRSVRWRSGFPRIAGPPVLFQRMLGARRVPDAFWSVGRPDVNDTV